MSIESTLRKEGIEVIKELDTLRVNSIAQRITNRLCSAFPEHCFSREDLFASFARLHMFHAKMTDSLCGAKYFYKNNSIYFNIDYSLSQVDVFALHECIHYLQEVKNENGNLIRLGLYDFTCDNGIALNEAAVQLMTSEALGENVQEANYYNLQLATPSPDYYPLECAIVRQMSYFTGTYPLYYSTLHGNDVFKNTFITIAGEKAFYLIENNLDKMMQLESELSCYSELLRNYNGSNRKIKKLKYLIERTKKEISNLFLSCQNTIISFCFSKELKNIRNLENVIELKNKLYKFKDYIATNDSYSFYNNFYCNMMESLEEKRKYIEEHGPYDFKEVLTSDITVVSNARKSISLLRRMLYRFGLLGQRDF